MNRHTLLLGLLLCGCGGTSQLGDMKERLDIDMSDTHALGLFATGRADEEGLEFELAALDAHYARRHVPLSTSPLEKAFRVADAGKYILIAAVNVYWQGRTCATVVVRKADGALTCLELNFELRSLGPLTLAQSLQTDASGDILYFTGYFGEDWSQISLMRVDLRDENAPAIRSLGQEPTTYLVNADGDVLANSGANYVGRSGTLHVYGINDQDQIITRGKHYSHCRSWVGDDQGFLYVGENLEGVFGIHRLTKNGEGSFSATLYAPVSETDFGGERTQQYQPCYVRTQDEVLLGRHSIARGKEAPQVLESIPLSDPPFPRVVSPVALEPEGFLYNQRSSIKRFHLPSRSNVTLVPEGSFEASRVERLMDGTLHLEATRVSDGTGVLVRLVDGEVRTREPLGAAELEEIVWLR